MIFNWQEQVNPLLNNSNNHILNKFLSRRTTLFCLHSHEIGTSLNMLMLINITFQTLLYGEKYPCDVAKLPVNIPKNRFKTTFPCVYTILFQISQIMHSKIWWFVSYIIHLKLFNYNFSFFYFFQTNVLSK